MRMLSSKKNNLTGWNFSSLSFLYVTFLSLSQLSATPLPIVFDKAPECPKLFSDADYNLGWDLNMSPYAGGEDILFGLRAVERIEGYFLGNNPICTSRALQSQIWRLSELITVWLPLNYLSIVADHEVFGHGYRIRDLGKGRAKVASYHIGVPIPYGPGGGATHYSITDAYTTSNATAVAMAGVESTAILAGLTKFKWLEAGKVDPRQTAMYILGQFDLPLYVGDLKVRNDEKLDGHDINDYIKTLNLTYTKSKLDVGNMYTLSLINLADAFTYYSIYSWFRYVITGLEGPIPMIRIKDYGWLPGARMGLTPFGPEYFLENYLMKEKVPYTFYLKWGNHSDNNYAGVGFFAPTIYKINRWIFGARFDAWFQPKYLSQQGNQPLLKLENDVPNPSNPLYSYSEQEKKIAGFSLSGLISFNIKGNSGLQLELGGKTKGFLPGNALDASPITRVYYTLHF
jgi:hypothetical protein